MYKDKKEKEICEIALFLTSKRTEGQLAKALMVDRLEARRRVQAFLNKAIENAQVPLDQKFEANGR